MNLGACVSSIKCSSRDFLDNPASARHIVVEDIVINDNISFRLNCFIRIKERATSLVGLGDNLIDRESRDRHGTTIRREARVLKTKYTVTVVEEDFVRHGRIEWYIYAHDAIRTHRDLRSSEDGSESHKIIVSRKKRHTRRQGREDEDITTGHDRRTHPRTNTVNIDKKEITEIVEGEMKRSRNSGK